MVATGCDLNSHVEFSIDYGVTWSTMLPVWADGVAVIARCVSDTDSNCYSQNSNIEIAILEFCCEENCFGITIIKN